MTANYTTQLNLSYGTGAQQVMDVFTPPDPIGTIILIHGGDWKGGDKSVFEGCKAASFQSYFANAFANAHFRVVNINYTLVGPTASWFDAYASVEAAVAYVKATYGGIVGAVGDSAGAQLASMLGVTGQVSFVGDNSGPEDLTLNNGQFPILMQMTGSVAAERAASPIDNLGPGAASFYITQGLQDPMVNPWAQAGAFNKALLAAGVSSTIRWYSGGHVFTATPWATEWGVLDNEITWAKGQVAGLAQAMAGFGAQPAASASLVVAPPREQPRMLAHAC